MERALVIGSEGNIGKPLVRHLRSLGHEVLSTDIKSGFREDYFMADINHPIDLLDAFDWAPTTVYLLASTVSRITCEQAGSLAITTNVAGINNVITLTKRVGANLVYFSTSEIYGPVHRYAKMAENLSPRPNNRYGLSKWLGEQIVQYEVSQGLQASIARPFMIYDENEELGDHRSAIIRFAHDLSKGKPIYVHSYTERSWLHIDDAVKAFAEMRHIEGGEVINIGHPDVINTRVLARMLAKLLDADESLIKEVPQPEKMTPYKNPELSKQKILLGFTPSISLDEGLQRVCQRFL